MYFSRFNNNSYNIYLKVKSRCTHKEAIVILKTTETLEKDTHCFQKSKKDFPSTYPSLSPPAIMNRGIFQYKGQPQAWQGKKIQQLNTRALNNIRKAEALSHQETHNKQDTFVITENLSRGTCWLGNCWKAVAIFCRAPSSSWSACGFPFG